MTRRSAADQAAWIAARDRVASYHERELAALIERLRSGLESLDAGEIDVFEFDDLVHRYKRSAHKLWSFCVGGGNHIRHTARVLQDAEANGAAFEWWEAGDLNRRQ